MLSSTKSPKIPNRESAHGADLRTCLSTLRGLMGDSYGSWANFMQPEFPTQASRRLRASRRKQDEATIGRVLRVSSAPVFLATH